MKPLHPILEQIFANGKIGGFLCTRFKKASKRSFKSVNRQLADQSQCRVKQFVATIVTFFYRKVIRKPFFSLICTYVVRWIHCTV
jgi:hypothetical protein